MAHPSQPYVGWRRPSNDCEWKARTGIHPVWLAADVWAWGDPSARTEGPTHVATDGDASAVGVSVRALADDGIVELPSDDVAMVHLAAANTPSAAVVDAWDAEGRAAHNVTWQGADPDAWRTTTDRGAAWIGPAAPLVAEWVPPHAWASMHAVLGPDTAATGVVLGAATVTRPFTSARWTCWLIASGTATATVFKSEDAMALCPFPDLHSLRRSAQARRRGGEAGDRERCPQSTTAQASAALLSRGDLLCQPPYASAQCTHASALGRRPPLYTRIWARVADWIGRSLSATAQMR